MSLGPQPSAAATFAAQMMNRGREPQLGRRPVSDGPFMSLNKRVPPITDPKMRPPTPPGGAIIGSPDTSGDAGTVTRRVPDGNLILTDPAGPIAGLYPPGTRANHEVSPLFAALRDRILGQTRHPDPLNQIALLARFLGGAA